MCIRDSNKAHCYLCAHQCKINPGQFGFCAVRKNVEGSLKTLVYGEVIAANIDPIEKKPLYHFLPGSQSFSIATIGCNFKCGFCQNWQISQVSKKDQNHPGYKLSPEDIVKQAKDNSCQSISYTYTEPTIFFEYAYDTAKLAKAEGLKNNFVTNGYMTKQALEVIKPYLDAANIDLKSFDDSFYKKICSGSLQPVLDSIEFAKDLGVWVEVTTLVVPGQNDSEEELRKIAEFIASVGEDIPWHISRFHPDYKFEGRDSTPLQTLKKAYNFGKQAGLKYIYLGNILDDSNTYCEKCGKLLVKRAYFGVSENNIKNGKCSFCQSAVDGVYQKA